MKNEDITKPKKTKKPNGAGGVRQRPDGKWEGRYTYCIDANGKPIRKSVYGNSFKEANEKLNEVLCSISNNTFIDPKKMTFVGWLEDWLETYAKIGIKSSTYSSYETFIRGHIKPYFKNTQLQTLRSDNLQKFINYKAENGRLDRKEGGISPKTITNIKNMIHAALKQAQINGLIGKNVADLVKSPKQSKHEMRVLTDKEFDMLLKTVKVERYGVPICLAMFTGLRVGEVLALKIEDIEIDSSEPTLYVRTSMKRDNKDASHNPSDEFYGDNEATKTVLIRGSTKTYTSKRDVPLIPEAVEQLQRQLKYRKEDIKASGEAYKNHNFLFSNPLGYPFDQRTYQDTFNKILKNAGIDKLSSIGTKQLSAGFHTLRHTFATRAIAAGMDILVLSKILGHAQPSTTLNKYGHVLPNHKRESMEKIRPLHLVMNESTTENAILKAK